MREGREGEYSNKSIVLGCHKKNALSITALVITALHS